MPLSTGAAKVSQAKSKLDIVATVQKAVEASDSIDEWKAALFTECRAPSAKSLLQAIQEYDIAHEVAWSFTLSSLARKPGRFQSRLDNLRGRWNSGVDTTFPPRCLTGLFRLPAST